MLERASRGEAGWLINRFPASRLYSSGWFSRWSAVCASHTGYCLFGAVLFPSRWRKVGIRENNRPRLRLRYLIVPELAGKPETDLISISLTGGL